MFTSQERKRRRSLAFESKNDQFPGGITCEFQDIIISLFEFELEIQIDL